MGVTYAASVTADTPVVTTTETIAVTVSGVTLPRPGMRVKIRGWCQITTGASTTALTPRVRRGTAITDPVVGDAVAEEIEAAAGSEEALDVMVIDTPGELAGGSYILTVQQTAASANGSILQAGIEAEVLD